MEARYMSNADLISLKNLWIIETPEIIGEIFFRAESFEPGILDLYLEGFSSCDINSDEVFDRAVSYLK